jgi:RNA polymerase-binding transcription factor DksA
VRVTENEIDRVEALLRERSAEMMRTRVAVRQRGAELEEPLPPTSGERRSPLHEGPVEARMRGTCLSCGHPIPPARLRALPHAVRCVDCQRAFEAERLPGL